MGLRLPSESLLWLLGGVGGKCRCSTEAEEKKADFIHQTAMEQDSGWLNSHPSTRPNLGQILHVLIWKDLQQILLVGRTNIKVQNHV